nr:hypothetical protein [Kibdelosporangium sp. MJ126-NF4]CEL21430.1 hypothetical protein [Kibdelosporangium sp. MJ126-NF4]CTQ96003.1 hypothetical protein [Kibdelosporangium sp. MJ126-NF4]
MGVLTPVVLVLVVTVLHIRLLPKLAPPARRWARAALYTPILALVVYAWGAMSMFTLDTEEVCRLVHHERYDPGVAGEHYFPLSKRCNGGFDLVPSWVNPTVVVLLVATAVFAALAVRATNAATRHAGMGQPDKGERTDHDG